MHGKSHCIIVYINTYVFRGIGSKPLPAHIDIKYVRPPPSRNFKGFPIV